MLKLTVRQPDWQKAIREIAARTVDRIPLILESVLADVVPYLKNLSQEQRGWATISGELEEGYGGEVTQVEGGWRLTLWNKSDHAIYLEARDGFFVLFGVMDPGGPVEDALVEVCAKIAPEFQVVRAA